MLNKRVAVILATFNGEEYLEEQIVSIFGQIDVDVTLYVRDDGSKDKTLEILRYYSKKNKIIFLSNDGQCSGSAAGNFFHLLISSSEADVDYYALADQDDIWAPRKLISAIENMGAIYDGYSSNLLSYNVTKLSSKYLIKSSPQVKFDHIFQGGSAGCTYVIKKELARLIVQKIKLLSLPERTLISHDWFIYMIARISGKKWLLSNSCHIFYRQHNNNVYGDVGVIQNFRKKLNLFAGGWYFNVLRVNRKFVNIESDDEIIYNLIFSKSILIRMKLINNLLELRRNPFESLILAAYVIIFGAG
jgi:rhamnosyltransferase